MLRFLCLKLLFLIVLGCSWENPESDDANNKTLILYERIPSGHKTTDIKPENTDFNVALKNKMPIRLEGSRVFRFEDGTKKQVLNYTDGKKNGVFKRWYSNGQLEKRGSYKDDRFDGFLEAWNEEGVRKWTGFYRDGKQHGEWILFDKSGNPMPAIYFKHGIETTHELPAFR